MLGREENARGASLDNTEAEEEEAEGLVRVLETTRRRDETGWYRQKRCRDHGVKTAMSLLQSWNCHGLFQACSSQRAA